MSVDASDLYRLSRDLGKISGKAAALVFDAVAVSAQDMRNTWRRNARLTAGKHGKRYPDSIIANMRIGTSATAEIGPDSRFPQGGMSFEFGSVNQPPHLDGQKALEEVKPRLDRRLDEALAGIAAVIADDKKREYVTRSGKTVMATDAQIAHWTRGSL